jgi:hypothetical protein
VAAGDAVIPARGCAGGRYLSPRGSVDRATPTECRVKADSRPWRPSGDRGRCPAPGARRLTSSLGAAVRDGGRHRRWRAVVVEPGQGEAVGGLNIAQSESGHVVTARGHGALRGPALRLASGTGGFRQMRGTHSTRSAMGTTAMMIRLMRTMARAPSGEPRDSWPPPAADSQGCPQLHENSKTSNIFLETVVVFEAWQAGAS